MKKVELDIKERSPVERLAIRHAKAIARQLEKTLAYDLMKDQTALRELEDAEERVRDAQDVLRALQREVGTRAMRGE
jgi:hypothetical protein